VRAALLALSVVLTAAAARSDDAWQVVEGTFGEASVESRALTWRAFGRADAPAVLLLGGIHGDERMAARLVTRFADELAAHPEWAPGRRVVVAAARNPDGLARGTRRNARGVDLNRNFPAKTWRRGDARGERPLSEPESRLVAHLLETFRPIAVVSVHAPFRCVNWDGPAEGLARLMARENGYELRPSIGYPTPGSLGSWLGERGVPIVTLELPDGAAEDGFLGENRGALRAALTWSP
jgi:protein MpaA